MKYTILLLVIGIILIVIPINISRPSFNSTNPGCDGGGCHTFQDAIVSASVTDLQVQVSVSGTSGPVAGELVDGSGTVVDCYKCYQLKSIHTNSSWSWHLYS